LSPGVSPGAALRAAAGKLGLDPGGARPAGGSAFRLSDGTRSVFLKILPAALAACLEAEAEGLDALAGPLRVPAVLGRGEAADEAWLALEWLELRRPDAAAAEAFGHALAQSHQRTAEAFGWQADNWIGASPQHNGWEDDWATFFTERRLRPQFDAARERGGDGLAEAGERLCAAVPALLEGHAPPASLVHGDLWGGNWGALGPGAPVTFDPAVHYADRECDLAMTELFGGFPATFYAAYREAWPLPPGYAGRRDLYQLYHVLNHDNLFGGGYGARARALTETLLRRVPGSG